jgi:raffinose synthase
MKQPPLTSLPQHWIAETLDLPGLSCAAVYTLPDPGKDLPAQLGTIKGQGRHLAISRINPWSLAPHFGRTPPAVPDETVMLLWEKESGGYGVLIPLVQAGQRAWLAGTPEGLELRSMAWDRAAASGPASLLFFAEGEDPFALVNASIIAISEKLRTFRPRKMKAVPRWIDWFGWCTWDAFYQQVNTEGVLAGLEKARAGGVVPRFLILDDGWQDTDGKMLRGFGAHPEKFPEGLAELIERARSEFGIQLFGAWHALEGYWFGVDPEGPVGQNYRVFDLTQSAHNRLHEAPERRALIHPDDIARFYHDYYRELRAAGVDFVKVDNQGSLDHFLNETTTPPTPTMQRYQEAFQGAAAHHFQSETLHCLSQVSDVLFHLDSANVMRNSEDYFPTRPATQGQHVFRNALNNVFMAPFCIPDWDMFQSSRLPAPFHAAARAICGGPIYISDKPGEQNFELLRKLITSEGRALRCEEPALPTRDCLFENAYDEPRLFKIQNKNGAMGVLGLFNCYWSEAEGGTVTGSYGPADVDNLEGDRFALFYHTNRRAQVAQREERFTLTLEPLDWELVTIAPLLGGVGVFGLADKLNGSAAVRSVDWINEDQLKVTLCEGGSFAVYHERDINSAIAGGSVLKTIRTAGNLSIIEVPGTIQVELTLVLA